MAKQSTAEEILLGIKKKNIDWFRDVKPNVCIGIDRSLNSTGIAVVSKGKLVYQSEISPGVFGDERLIVVVKAVMEIVEKVYQRATPLIVMEDYAFARANQAHQIGEMGGVMKAAFSQKDYPYLQVAPQALKKYVTGKGNTNKAMMPMKVLKKFGVEPKGGDAADAIGCAFFGYNAFQYLMGHGKYTVAETETFDTFLSLEKKKRKKSSKKKNKELAAEINE